MPSPATDPATGAGVVVVAFLFVDALRKGVSLSSFEPDPAWDPEAYAETVAAFSSLPETAVVHVWGGDWCGDCRRELPALAAALDAADLPPDQIAIHPVTSDKDGALVDAYDVTRVPTVVVQVDGDPVARFEEKDRAPAPVAVAETLRDKSG